MSNLEWYCVFILPSYFNFSKIEFLDCLGTFGNTVLPYHPGTTDSPVWQFFLLTQWSFSYLGNNAFKNFRKDLFSKSIFFSSINRWYFYAVMLYELVLFEVQRKVAINGIVVIIFRRFGYFFLDEYNIFKLLFKRIFGLCLTFA